MKCRQLARVISCFQLLSILQSRFAVATGDVAARSVLAVCTKALSHIYDDIGWVWVKINRQKLRKRVDLLTDLIASSYPNIYSHRR